MGPDHTAPISASAATAGSTPSGDHCAYLKRLSTPGAERQEAACLADLTTAGTTLTGHTNPDDWAGLHAPGPTNPTGVPGVQIDGYFPDTSTGNTNHAWNHDSQFVIRLPDRWNGGLVMTGGGQSTREAPAALECVHILWVMCTHEAENNDRDRR